MDEQAYDPECKRETLTLEQFVKEKGTLTRRDMSTYSLALHAIELLPADEPIVALAMMVVSSQDVFEEAWIRLGGQRYGGS